MTRLLLFLLFMGVGTSIAYLVLEEPRQPGVGAEEAEEGPLNEMHLTRVMLQEQVGDHIRLKLWAEKAVYSVNRDTARLYSVRFELDDPQARQGKGVLVRGVAEEGRLNQQSGLITLLDKVRLTEGEDLEIRSDKIDYFHKEGIVNAPREVWIKQQDTVHQGRDMTYFLNKQTLTLRQPLLAH